MMVLMRYFLYAFACLPVLAYDFMPIYFRLPLLVCLSPFFCGHLSSVFSSPALSPPYFSSLGFKIDRVNGRNCWGNVMMAFVCSMYASILVHRYHAVYPEWAATGLGNWHENCVKTL